MRTCRLITPSPDRIVESILTVSRQIVVDVTTDTIEEFSGPHDYLQDETCSLSHANIGRISAEASTEGQKSQRDFQDWDTSNLLLSWCSASSTLRSRAESWPDVGDTLQSSLATEYAFLWVAPPGIDCLNEDDHARLNEWRRQLWPCGHICRDEWADRVNKALSDTALSFLLPEQSKDTSEHSWCGSGEELGCARSFSESDLSTSEEAGSPPEQHWSGFEPSPGSVLSPQSLRAISARRLAFTRLLKTLPNNLTSMLSVLHIFDVSEDCSTQSDITSSHDKNTGNIYTAVVQSPYPTEEEERCPRRAAMLPQDDFKSHLGHKYWEWDGHSQRWHRRGESPNSEIAWFPEEFA